jgi:hypothetical protein
MDGELNRFAVALAMKGRLFFTQLFVFHLPSWLILIIWFSVAPKFNPRRSFYGSTADQHDRGDEV